MFAVFAQELGRNLAAELKCTARLVWTRAASVPRFQQREVRPESRGALYHTRGKTRVLGRAVSVRRSEADQGRRNLELGD